MCEINDRYKKPTADTNKSEPMLQSQYKALFAKYEKVTAERDNYRAKYEETIQSTSWRVTKPLRKAKSAGRQMTNRFPALRRLYRFIAAVKSQGLRQAKYNKRHYEDYFSSLLIPGWRTLEKQRATNYETHLTFSIATPLYNTPEKYLRDLICFMQEQTYSEWQLCFADGSDAGHMYVGDVIREYMEKDGRIHYKKLDRNGGISDNTNAALEMATGEYIGLLDHDDILSPNALYEMRQVIDEQGADFIYSDEVTFLNENLQNSSVYHMKPDFAIDNLRANNYICHFSVFKKSLLHLAGGGFRNAYDGSQDYDMVLRLTEQAKKIVHIPKILYFWRNHVNSVAYSIDAKPYAVTSAISAISDHLNRQGLDGNVQVAPGMESIYKINYKVVGRPMISILIPNRDEVSTLKTCIESIIRLSTWPNYEIIVCENNSKEPSTFSYYDDLEQMPSVRVVHREGAFNYSAVNNFAAQFAVGEHLLFLNNDTKVITSNWIEELLMYSQRDDVGGVGAKLYYPDDTLQHAGVVLGTADTAVHMQAGSPCDRVGYMGNLMYARNVSALTAACIMIRCSVFDQVGGFNESFPIAYNDVDLCMRIRKAGYLLVFTPFAELYHYESKTRGVDTLDREKEERLKKDKQLLLNKWGDVLTKCDPYFNPNFRMDTHEYTLDFKKMHGN